MHPSGRAVLLALSLAVLLAAPAPGAGAPVKVRHVTFESAEAAWLQEKDGGVYIYYLLAYRIERAGGESRTRLFVDKSRCRLRKSKGRKLATCLLEGRVEKLERRDLTIQPLLAGARLDFRDHHVVWERPGEMKPDVDPFVDPAAAFADAYVQRLSAARGRLYGVRMRKRALDRAALSYGADVAVIASEDEVPPKLRFRVRAPLSDG